jgi:glycosyltransferase involved in cell wall biosynthesis
LLNIYHTIAGLHPDSGGPARTVTSLCASLVKIPGVEVSLITQSITDDRIYYGSFSPDRTYVAESRSHSYLKSGRLLKALLERQLSETTPEIVHDHGVWLPSNHAVATWAKKHRVPLVVQPRGMLEPWAISFRAYKKKIAWSLYQKKNLDAAALFFATSQTEADNLRKLDFTQPIAVIPNGVDLPDIDLSFDAGQVTQRERNVVFMSRVHPKKGLKGLLEAWATLGVDNWTLTLVGPDEGGHLQEVLTYAKKLRIENKVVYRGVMEGAGKASLLQHADLFILPSFSENFGVVVAEALAYGVPVISTFGTPWRGLVENNCGWWVDAEPEALAGALRDAMALTDKERYKMGARGRKYAREFDWGHIAEEAADVYRWLLGKADRPDCVRLD